MSDASPKGTPSTRKGAAPRSITAARPRAPGVAIDTRALDRVIDYPAADMTITVEAGITISALQAALASQGQRLLIDAPHPDRATIGGVFATNTSGPRRFGAGRPRDQIIGVSFVTSDGRSGKGGGRVVKNVAGYDFPRLLTGSLGTLGVIAQLTLKVRPSPRRRRSSGSTFGRIEDVGAALDRLNTSATRPIALELLNHAAARLRSVRSARPAAGRLRPGRRVRGQRPVGRLAGRALAEASWISRSVAILEGERRVRSGRRLTEFQAVETGPGHDRGQPAAVVGRAVRRRARSGALGRPGARRQRDRPSPLARGVRSWNADRDRGRSPPRRSLFTTAAT